MQAMHRAVFATSNNIYPKMYYYHYSPSSLELEILPDYNETSLLVVNTSDSEKIGKVTA